MNSATPNRYIARLEKEGLLGRSAGRIGSKGSSVPPSETGRLRRDGEQVGGSSSSTAGPGAPAVDVKREMEQLSAVVADFENKN